MNKFDINQSEISTATAYPTTRMRTYIPLGATTIVYRLGSLTPSVHSTHLH